MDFLVLDHVCGVLARFSQKDNQNPKWTIKLQNVPCNLWFMRLLTLLLYWAQSIEDILRISSESIQFGGKSLFCILNKTQDLQGFTIFTYLFNFMSWVSNYLQHISVRNGSFQALRPICSDSSDPQTWMFLNTSISMVLLTFYLHVHS